MNHIAEITPAPRARRSHKESPLGLYIAVVKERPTASEAAQKAAFKRLVLSEGYEDFVEAIIEEWQSIKYSTAKRAAQPPGIKEIRETVAKRRKEREIENSLTTTAKQILGARLLNVTMPNGKVLGDCTGAECAGFGGFYSALGERVGPNRIVRDTITPDEIAKLAKQTKLSAA